MGLKSLIQQVSGTIFGKVYPGRGENACKDCLSPHVAPYDSYSINWLRVLQLLLTSCSL